MNKQVERKAPHSHRSAAAPLSPARRCVILVITRDIHISTTKGKEKERVRKPFPPHTLQEALSVPHKIADEMGGKPFKRLLLADALGIKPSSSNFRDILSSSYKYGLSDGTEKASEISLTSLGKAATQTKDAAKRLKALREAALKPKVFGNFYSDFKDKKVPSILEKILINEYQVPKEHASECARIVLENGRFVEIIRDIGGSPHVLLEETVSPATSEVHEPEESETNQEVTPERPESVEPRVMDSSVKPKPIFIGHGKNVEPRQKLEKILSTFQIPYRVTIHEANLGRPIPQKVKETMLECGSAILIFTKDEKFLDDQGNEIWRPSENVVHELGASSFAYGDRIVIFKEKGIHFPTNFQSIGYIEFETASIESKTTELLKELVGFGLVKITPV